MFLQRHLIKRSYVAETIYTSSPVSGPLVLVRNKEFLQGILGRVRSLQPASAGQTGRRVCSFGSVLKHTSEARLHVEPDYKSVYLYIFKNQNEIHLEQ